MPKKNFFSKKNKRSPNSFDSMITPKPEVTELDISAPLTKKETQPSRKMTLLELPQFIEDIKEKLPLLEKKENRSEEEQKLLSLMRSIKNCSETDFLEELKESTGKMANLIGLIQRYIDKDIDWKPYDFVETELNNTVAPTREPIDPLNLTPNQTRSPIQELQGFHFNGDKQNHQKTFSISKKNGSLELLADLKNALQRNKDNAGCVKKSNASDGVLLTDQKFIEEEVSEIIDSSPTSSGMFFNSQDTKPIIVGKTIKPTLSC